jgi:hypothetical protein
MPPFAGVLLAAFALGCCPAAAPKGAASDAEAHAASDDWRPGGIVPVAWEVRADERHFAALQQLTREGENAEAYWSFGGASLVLQARREPGRGCDQIYRMALDARPPAVTRISTGRGATTCAFFLPGDREIVYASTHLAGAACPPPPDKSRGYVWALHPGYDIFRVPAAGGEAVRLTETPGYDAEATVCGKDGTIVFTSVRDGDLELYSMRPDGSGVRRLTNSPGYDGGAFFDAACERIVWRAARPEGRDLEEYRELLAQGLVRPRKLELWVANADGSEPRQVTYLDAASFAPFFHPGGRRILFSSNHGDPRGREFDLWAIDVDGTRLERVTTAPGFDGFPMFSPDGRRLAFSSNRATKPGSHETNLFVADWRDEPLGPVEEAGADRVLGDVAFLASAELGGRGLGTAEIERAAAFVEGRLAAAGAAAPEGGARQRFEVVTALGAGASALSLDGAAAARAVPLSFSSDGDVAAPVVLAGWGIVSPEHGRDDYAGVAPRGKVVVVRRGLPPELEEKLGADADAKRRLSDLRHKAWRARERGARALLAVDVAEGREALPLPELRPEGAGQDDAGIVAMALGGDEARALVARLEARRPARARLRVRLERIRSGADNVVMRLAAGAPEAERLAGAVVVGAHYDHLGLGSPGSLAPGVRAAHVGADDNASGVAGLIEIARALAARRAELRRDVLVVAFSGEESGVLGSSHFVRNLPAGMQATDIVAMLNLDMIGRLRNNTVSVLGAKTAREWPDLVGPACRGARVRCELGGEGYGPSDQTPFYAAGIPVLHFFTGAHADYHKPSDTPDRINAAGLAQIARIVADVGAELARRPERLTYERVASPPPDGDLGRSRASLGTIPDYGGPPPGMRGVLVGAVRPGGAAERAGIARGDVLVRLGGHDLADVRDLMFALGAHKPGETVTVALVRDGRRIELTATLEERHGGPR